MRCSCRPYYRGTSVIQGQDVLLFIDKHLPLLSGQVLRFPHFLSRMPSAVGYQPTLATEMGELQGVLPARKVLYSRTD